MKRKVTILSYLLGLGLVSGCGLGNQGHLSSQFGSDGGQSGLAVCNSFKVSTLLQANVEHPTVGANTENYLDVWIKQLDSSFFSNASNSITFYRMAVSPTGQSIDSTPLTITLSSGASTTTLTPAAAQASNPLIFILNGTTVSYNVIEVDLRINGSVTSSKFLIPAFDADPETYQTNPAHTASLSQLHPFYSLSGQALDFVGMSNTFCFL